MQQVSEISRVGLKVFFYITLIQIFIGAFIINIVLCNQLSRCQEVVFSLQGCHGYTTGRIIHASYLLHLLGDNNLLFIYTSSVKLKFSTISYIVHEYFIILYYSALVIVSLVTSIPPYSLIFMHLYTGI